MDDLPIMYRKKRQQLTELARLILSESIEEEEEPVPPSVEPPSVGPPPSEGSIERVDDMVS